MRKPGKQTPSRAIIILRQIEKHEWIFKLPRINDGVDHRLEEGIDWIDADPKRAASIFMNLVDEYPEHMDACHHLALTLEQMGKKEEAFVTRKLAVDTALTCFPMHFSMDRDRLEWGFVENRPFLRLYHSFGLQLMKRAETEKALEVFENILALNPNDNQGARGLAVECYFALKRPEEVLSFCRQYPGEMMEHLIYGRALAMFQLCKVKEAAKALDVAITNYPLIATELLMTKHRKPKGIKEGYVTLGGPDQAFLYWKEHGKYWAETPGAIEFLRDRFLGRRTKRR
jgi:tetratricopeptide (TPR) repeat protein